MNCNNFIATVSRTTTAASSSLESLRCCKGDQLKSSSSYEQQIPTRKPFCLRSPPPSQHLKKILANYPEGPQIFQEALQNADDAKAAKFRVILDERTHRCKISQLNRFMVRKYV